MSSVSFMTSSAFFLHFNVLHCIQTVIMWCFEGLQLDRAGGVASHDHHS